MNLRWVFVAIAPVGLLAAALITQPTTKTAFPVNDSTELRVLKVSLGTNHFLSNEPLWKQTIRRFLPDPWEGAFGAFQGERHSTSHSALVVWVGEFHRQSGAIGMGIFEMPEAVFRDGNVVRGATIKSRTCLEFRSFDRVARDIPLRVRCGGQTVSFTVRNPRPVRMAQWKARPIPQTNRVSNTDIVVRELRPPRT